MAKDSSVAPSSCWPDTAQIAAPGSAGGVSAWRVVQDILLVAGVALVFTLLLRPALGLDLLWNGLIPLAPALIVIAPGLWRNVCPMATFSQLPRRFGLSRRLSLPRPTAAALAAMSVVALFLIVPLRHLTLDVDGPGTALMLALAALVAFALGVLYDGRSAWCNALCPIHPAERLYGQVPALSLANARCAGCSSCSAPCPESLPSLHPLMAGPSPVARAVGHLMVGGFAGFIWGWYRIPDYPGLVAATDVTIAYAWPFGAALVSLLLYGVAYRRICKSVASRRRLIRLFAAFAVCTYYWYRIPALAGFGPHPGTGMLWDLTASLPRLPWLSRPLTTAFFVWFLVVRPDPKRSWTLRPAPSVRATDQFA